VLQELAAGGASVIVSSHILSELADMCTSVGIMHQGRLLQHGPIASTLESIRTEAVVVRIELMERSERAIAWLGAHEQVDEIEVDGLRINFRFRGNKRDQSALLRELVAGDHPVISFTPREMGIESLLIALINDE
jgi:ABC-2 type transport system ATP-binding protein